MPARPAAKAPDRPADDHLTGTLKTGAVPVDHRYVHASSLFPARLRALRPVRAGPARRHGARRQRRRPPYARTDAATAITATGATLNGFVGTNGQTTAYTFGYGTSVPSAKFAPSLPAVVSRGPGRSRVGDRDGPDARHHVPRPSHRPAPGTGRGDRQRRDLHDPRRPGHRSGSGHAGPAPTTGAPVPTLGESVVVAPVKGDVLVKAPGAATYTPLATGGAVPTGAVVDTRNGQVALTTAVTGGKTQTATFERGVFQVRQSKTGKGLTDIYLRGPAPSCGSSRSSGRAAAVAKRKPKKRQLWGRDKGGRFRTHGANSVATVRGTVDHHGHLQRHADDASRPAPSPSATSIATAPCSCARATATSRAGASLRAMARPLKRLLDSGRVRGPHVTAVLVTGMIAAVVGVIGEASHLLPGVESRHGRAALPGPRAPAPRTSRSSPSTTSRSPTSSASGRSRARLHAQAIDRLRDAGAREIVYDVQFTEPTTRARGPRAATTRSAAPATSSSRRPRPTAAARPTCSAATRTSRAAHAARRRQQPARPTPGGVDPPLHRATRAGCDTVAVAVVRARGRPRAAPGAFDADGAWIDYRGPPGHDPDRTRSPTSSAARSTRALLRGKIVVVGATAPTLQDVHATPDRGRRADVGPRGPGQRDLDARCTACRCASAPAWLDLLRSSLLALAAAARAPARPRPLAAALAAPLARRSSTSPSPSSRSTRGIGRRRSPRRSLALALGTVGDDRRQLPGRAPRAPRASRATTSCSRTRVRERTAELRETAARDRPAPRARRPSRATATPARTSSGSSRLCERARARRGHERRTRPSCCATRARCTTSARSASPTASCSSPASSTPEEREVMQRHTTIGAAILAGSPLAAAAARRGDRAHPPRALGRQRLPGRACAARRSRSPGGSARSATSSTRCVSRAPVQGAVAARATRSPRSSRSARPALRPRARRGVPPALAGGRPAVA